MFASNFKAKQLYLLDHDKEYISMLDNLIHWLDINIKVIISKFEFGIDALDTYDVIITLSTIHWFYSATTNIGCLFTIIKMLADKVNKYLIIEWIDPEDSAIKSFHHIDFNKTVHKTAYTRENLELALSNNFTNVIKVGKTERYREIYFCSKL